MSFTTKFLLGLDAGGLGTHCQTHVDYLVVIKVKKFIFSTLVVHSLEINSVPQDTCNKQCFHEAILAEKIMNTFTD